MFFENVHLAHLVKKPEAEYLLLGFTLVKAASKVLPELVQIMQSKAPLDFGLLILGQLASDTCIYHVAQ